MVVITSLSSVCCQIPAGCKTLPSFSELIDVKISSDFICFTDVVYHQRMSAIE